MTDPSRAPAPAARLPGRRRWYLALVAAVLSGLYVIKVILHVDLLPDFSLADHVPGLAKLESGIVTRPPVGELVRDDFQRAWLSRRNWHQFWAREPEAVTVGLAVDTEDGGRAMNIRNAGDRDWCYDGYQQFRVEAGQRYEVTMRVRTRGVGRYWLVMNGYDDELRFAHRGLGTWTLERAADWSQLRFDVPMGAEAPFVAFRLVGDGRGELWIDDFVVTRTK